MRFKLYRSCVCWILVTISWHLVDSEEDICSTGKCKTFTLSWEDVKDGIYIREFEKFISECATLNDVTFSTIISQSETTESTTEDNRNSTAPVNPDPNPPVCLDYLPEGGCIWFDIRPNMSMTYEEAKKICEKHDSVVATIATKQVYDMILKNVNELANVTNENFTTLWSGTTIDPSNKAGKCSNTMFCHWYNARADVIGKNANATQISIYVNETTENLNYSGMLNTSSDKEMHGVVCYYKNGTILPPGWFVGDSCKNRNQSGCYWTYATDPSSLNFAHAQDICKTNGSYIGIIHTKEVYDKVVNYVSTHGQNNATFFLNTTYNPKKGTTSPINAYQLWRSGFPKKKECSQCTQIFLHVHKPGDYGMDNRVSTEKVRGVICWKPRVLIRPKTQFDFE